MQAQRIQHLKCLAADSDHKMSDCNKKVFGFFSLTLVGGQLHQKSSPRAGNLNVNCSHEIQEAKYAFLSILEIAQLGFCGGLLVLSARGRPVEFHCSAPVKANRAQEILYGQTLKEFVCCDQIGIALIDKVKSRLDLVLVDENPLLCLAESMQVPVVCVNAVDENETRGINVTGSLIELGDRQFEFRGETPDRIEILIDQFTKNLPATEPFERIRLAISEAHAEAA